MIHKLKYRHWLQQQILLFKMKIECMGQRIQLKLKYNKYGTFVSSHIKWRKKSGVISWQAKWLLLFCRLKSTLCDIILWLSFDVRCSKHFIFIQALFYGILYADGREIMSSSYRDNPGVATWDNLSHCHAFNYFNIYSWETNAVVNRIIKLCNK